MSLVMRQKLQYKPSKSSFFAAIYPNPLQDHFATKLLAFSLEFAKVFFRSLEIFFLK